MRKWLLAFGLILAATQADAQAWSGAYDSDAVAYFNALTGNSCSAPSASFKTAVSNFVYAEKAVGNWGNQDAEYILATTDSCTASINLAQPSLYKVTWNGSPTFTVQSGLPCDGSSQYGDTGINQSSLKRMAQANAHLEAWAAANKSFVLGLVGSANAFQLQTTTNKTTKLNSSQLTDNGGGTAGLHYADKTATTTLTTGLNGVTQSAGATVTNVGEVASNVAVCKANTSFGAAGANVLFWGFGAIMNDEASHYTNVRNLLLALGVTGI